MHETPLNFCEKKGQRTVTATLLYCAIYKREKEYSNTQHNKTKNEKKKLDY